MKKTKPKVCVPLVSKNKKQLLEDLETLNNHTFDVIEWRLDHYDEDILEGAKIIHDMYKDSALLVTFRTIYEGGNRIHEDYQHVYDDLIKSGYIDLVDVEFSRGHDVFEYIRKLAHAHQIRVVASYHDFEKTPGAKFIMSQFETMKALKADVFKIALMPKTIEDVCTLLTCTYHASEKYEEPIITMSMSSLGAVSRFTGEIFGSAMTFGSVQKSSAPGQIEVDKLQTILESIHEAGI